MSVSLPLANQRWPKFRLLTRASWGGTTSSGGGWTIQAMQRPSQKSSGFILLNYSRALLPQYGNAQLMFRFGLFGDVVIGATAETNTRMQQGEQWDPDIDELDIPDLTGQEIRIQAAYPDEDGVVDASDWATVWWGTCEYQEDMGWGGASIPSGDRIYNCIDAFARTQRWFLDRHGSTDGASTFAPASGHPGYNTTIQNSTGVSGNKGPAGRTWVPSDGGVYAKTHTMPGTGEQWTDQEVLDNALIVSRPAGQPLWQVSGAAGALALMAGTGAWKVQDGAPVSELINRICARSRGRGAVFPTWSEASPTGPLTCLLKVYAQLAADVTYTNPAAGGGSVTIDGAIADGTEVTVDLIGDHRFVPDSLKLSDPEQYRVDHLISYGERIETLVTLEHGKTLEDGWAVGERGDFIALDPDERTSFRWQPVFNYYRLIREFDSSVSDGNQGSMANADYKCMSDGSITDVSIPWLGSSYLTSVEVLDDLPIYEGYNYIANAITRYDGQTVAAFAGQPVRRPPLLMIRTDDDKFKHHDQWEFSVQLKNLPDGFMLICQEDAGAGTRLIGDTTEANLGSIYDRDDLVMTVGLRLGSRVSMESGDPTGKRKMRVYHPDLHLWIAAPNAIWDLDAENADETGSPPRRGAATSVNGVLRDDRATLARLHAITRIWYGLATENVDDFAATHRGASWSLRCCGDIPTGEDYDGGGLEYPMPGKVVRFLYANGIKNELNSPVSSYVYDNTNGVSTWTCDWMDLDHA